ncbi:hypothetical protein PGTUg99_021904 [Puccinia graminis f. sp. tritici]|uniref:Uncharacterized protein n=1 Tax=Puccinia graminis f. sp. tritici TaxID=56615 RepID=A0A5B0M7Q3_PUCGR|nr:hypothetical protein PGTUg99_021904 [Puccinia graminis f. sp. tritici]
MKQTREIRRATRSQGSTRAGVSQRPRSRRNPRFPSQYPPIHTAVVHPKVCRRVLPRVIATSIAPCSSASSSPSSATLPSSSSSRSSSPPPPWPSGPPSGSGANRPTVSPSPAWAICSSSTPSARSMPSSSTPLPTTESIDSGKLWVAKMAPLASDYPLGGLDWLPSVYSPKPYSYYLVRFTCARKPSNT